jgi:hypothetical protein
MAVDQVSVIIAPRLADQASMLSELPKTQRFVNPRIGLEAANHLQSAQSRLGFRKAEEDIQNVACWRNEG